MRIFDLQLRFQEAFDLFSLFLSSVHFLSLIGYILSWDLLLREELNRTHRYKLRFLFPDLKIVTWWCLCYIIL